MAKRKRQTTRQQIEKRLKEGRGQGTLADYKPWHTIQDVPSKGNVTRIKGSKTQRPHHLLSTLERYYYYHLEFSPEVSDIREQFPLDLTETLAIANELGVSHPHDRVTHENVVMTTDFLITLRQSLSTIDKARTIKYSKDLCEERALQKLEIERVYWENRNIDWAIVTERNFDKILIRNLENLHSFLEKDNLSIPVTSLLIRRAKSLFCKILERNCPILLKELTGYCDRELKLENGSSHAIFCHLVANRGLDIDLTKPISLNKRVFLSVTKDEDAS